MRPDFRQLALRASAAVDLAWQAFATVRQELALAAFSTDEQSAFTAQQYASKAKYLPGAEFNQRGLFEFERLALQAHFPAPPARVLVGACGGGREVLALRQMGYAVAAAYDPAAALVEGLRGTLADRTPLLVAAHESLRAEDLAAALPIDAVLVGWGSYTHVLGRAQRVAFLKTLRQLCPTGPVLLSYFKRAQTGRRRENVRRVAQAAIQVASLGRAHRHEDGDHYFAHVGFCHAFAPGEVTEEATEAGYVSAFEADAGAWYPHAVLKP